MTGDLAAIIAFIRNRIEETGWSETARRSGIRRETLHRVFGDSGKRGSIPNMLTVACVAEALGVKIEARLA